MKFNKRMKKNPFLHNNSNPEGSDRERFFVKHALRREHTEIPDEEAEWKRIAGMINLDSTDDDSADDSLQYNLARTGRWFNNRIFLTVAAAALILITLGFYYLINSPQASVKIELYIADRNNLDDIIMTSPDGAETVVEQNKLIAINKDNTVEKAVVGTVTLETPAGKEMAVLLPDSTKIWLWPNSKLEFPEKFTGDIREITLSGQAYLDVAHMPDKPFVVNTPYFSTRVYGTEFGICATTLKDASVTLVDGSLAVVPDNGGHDEILLRPDQEITFDSNGITRLRDVDTYQLRQWRDGLFYFEHESLFNILLSLGKWYNVSVVVSADIDLDEPYHFVADRNQPLDLIIDSFSDVSDIMIEFDGDQITVSM